jgi:hypothetical protein
MTETVPCGLQVLADGEGMVLFGWLAEDVLFVRLTGSLSSSMGSRFASRLGSLISRVNCVRYFSDASELTSYDLLAKSAFARVVMEHRRRFASMTMLTWTTASGPTAEALLGTLGVTGEVMTNRRVFETRLFDAAPRARRILEQTATQTQS